MGLLRAAATALHVCAVACICLLAHELGHALAGMALGGTVKRFILISTVPHVGIAGTFTAAEWAFQAVSGSLAELGLWLTAIGLAPRTAVWRRTVDVLSVMVGVEVCGWTLASLIHPFGPTGNDAAKFLNASGCPPAYIVAACFLVTVAAIVCYRRYARPKLVPQAAKARAAAA